MHAYRRTRFLVHLSSLLIVIATPSALGQKPAASTTTQLAQFVSALREKSSTFESSSGMRQGFQSFTAAHNLPPDSIRYSDYVLVRLLFEATRDAGFWNMHWSITDQPPNSDRIWRQWKGVQSPSFRVPTAIAECDELSALFAFLLERTGVKSTGLFWLYPNHTVAVWTLRPAGRPAIRVVVPTSQIFLTESDTFDTKRFNPWHQKTIYEYTRRDVPDSFELPKPLSDFFLEQVDKYAGTSEATLQQLRYLRDAVFVGSFTPEQAAREALRLRNAASSVPAEDAAAFQYFASDMRAVPMTRKGSLTPLPH
jgi:hypothetical protein